MGIIKAVGQVLEDFIWGKDPASLYKVHISGGVAIVEELDPKQYAYCESHKRYHLKDTDHGYQTRESFLRELAEEQLARR